MRYRNALAGALAVGLLLAAHSAFAGRGGSGGSSSTVTLVQLGGTTVAAASTDPWFGEQVTFDVHTSSSQPTVVAQCYQDGSLVYAESHGFWSGSAFGTTFTLGPTDRWTGGGATCTTDLIDYTKGKNGQKLASTSFDVTG
jgi:hypothetical protein